MSSKAKRVYSDRLMRPRNDIPIKELRKVFRLNPSDQSLERLHRRKREWVSLADRVPNRRGYVGVSMWRHGARRTLLRSRLVFALFHGHWLRSLCCWPSPWLL